MPFDEQLPQLEVAVPLVVEEPGVVEAFIQLRQDFHESGLEGRDGHDVPHRLLTGAAELDGAAERDVVELERPQVLKVVPLGDEADLVEPPFIDIVVFAVDVVLPEVGLQRGRREVDVLFAPLDAVEGHGADVRHHFVHRGEFLVVDVHVVGVHAVHAVLPEVVPRAEEVFPGGVREEQRFHRLQPREGVEGLDERVFLRVQLDLGGTAEEAEVWAVVEEDRARVLRIGLEVVEQHPVPAVGDGDIVVEMPVRVQPHARQRVVPGQEEVLNERVVPAEPVVDVVQVLIDAEGELQRVETAVVGEAVAGDGVGGIVDVPVVVPQDVRKAEPGEERVGQGVYHGKVDGLFVEVHDGQFEFEAGVSLLRPFGRGDILFIDQFVKGLFDRRLRVFARGHPAHLLLPTELIGLCYKRVCTKAGAKSSTKHFAFEKTTDPCRGNRAGVRLVKRQSVFLCRG